MKKVLILALEDTASIAVTGPLDILTEAGRYWMRQDASRRRSYFDIELVSIDSRPVTSLSNYKITCHKSVDQVSKTDLILIPSLSEEYSGRIKSNWKFVEWMREQYHKGAEIASFCTGSFLLAATGLLDGKRATTHWMAFEEFIREVEILDEQPFLIDQRMF